ncbi:WLM domain-containing protein [Chytridium lagenaria]|nr:WLM domain-containing protein [Chytridium lagenaria]
MSANTTCVVEFKTCGKVNDHEALSILKRVASLVKPIMKKRNWTIPLLREFFPQNPNLLGLNVNRGKEIRLRLRPHHDEMRFLEFEDVLGTMLHELTHNAISPHNAEFYKYLDDLFLELQDLRNKGWHGEGFDAPGFRVGMGISHNVPETERRKAALQAAETRATVNKIMIPSGGRKLGGNAFEVLSNEARMSPKVMAALAAERRRRDALWCGSGDGEAVTGKRRLTTLPPDSSGLEWKCGVCTLENAKTFLACEACGTDRPSDDKKGSGSSPSKRVNRDKPLKPDSGASKSFSSRSATSTTSKEWSCPECGWVQPLSHIFCEACHTIRDDDPKPWSAPTCRKPIDAISRTWPCPVCTLANRIEAKTCEACETSRPNKYGGDEIEEKPARVEEVWVCPECEGQTEDMFRMCRTCQYIRPL